MQFLYIREMEASSFCKAGYCRVLGALQFLRSRVLEASQFLHITEMEAIAVPAKQGAGGIAVPA